MCIECEETKTAYQWHKSKDYEGEYCCNNCHQKERRIIIGKRGKRALESLAIDNNNNNTSNNNISNDVPLANSITDNINNNNNNNNNNNHKKARLQISVVDNKRVCNNGVIIQ